MITGSNYIFVRNCQENKKTFSIWPSAKIQPVFRLVYAKKLINVSSCSTRDSVLFTSVIHCQTSISKWWIKRSSFAWNSLPNRVQLSTTFKINKPTHPKWHNAYLKPKRGPKRGIPLGNTPCDHSAPCWYVSISTTECNTIVTPSLISLG